MALFENSWIYYAICLTTALIAIIVAFFKWSFTYWKQRNVETIPPKIPCGNATALILRTTHFSKLFKDAYDTFKRKQLRYGGFYLLAKPLFVPIDPEIVKNILQKDFQHFVNHGSYYNEKDDPLSAHLFALEDTKWKNLRAKLTPTFTSGRLKAMFQTLVDCSKELTVLMDASSKGTPVDIKDILGRFTMDIIGSCAFGIDCNSLKDPNAQFRLKARRMFDIGVLEGMKQFSQFILTKKFLNKLGMKIVKPDVSDFFTQVVKDTVEYREKNNVHRKDFMHLLLQLKNRGQLSDDGEIVSKDGAKANALSLNEITAQAFIFFLAGFETSSTTMTFALYELAHNQKVQQKLRDEINEVMANHDNQLTYDALMEMRYMDKVINETLRKYPPLGVLNRECNIEYKVPGTDLTIEKGTQVWVPIVGLHYDPEYYPDPEEFKPERFSPENINKRPPFTFLPFGEGPRVCIGMRFGIMQTKVGLVSILRNYKVTLNAKTKMPLEMESGSIVLSAKGGVWLDIRKL